MILSFEEFQWVIVACFFLFFFLTRLQTTKSYHDTHFLSAMADIYISNEIKIIINFLLKVFFEFGFF